jgi:catechol 2,3-dioxygenase-like lactoylglutathione lyase family enzyme
LIQRPSQSIAHIALVVRDYDEAIDFYVGVLGFSLVEDTHQPEQDKRWVLVAPPGSDPRAGAATILLARASSPEQERFIGDQAGGRVFLFLRTNDFTRDYEAMRRKGVTFVREPLQADYGTVAVFLDLYGNRWDLVEISNAAPGLIRLAVPAGGLRRALERGFAQGAAPPPDMRFEISRISSTGRRAFNSDQRLLRSISPAPYRTPTSSEASAIALHHERSATT